MMNSLYKQRENFLVDFVFVRIYKVGRVEKI